MIKGKKETDFTSQGDPRPMLGRLGLPPTEKPCKECPLRKDSAPGYLGGYTAENYIAILHSDAQIACHMSPGFPHDHSQQRHCTGVCGYRANVGKMPRGPETAQAVEQIGKSAEFFESPLQFLEHHKQASDKYRAEVAKRSKTFSVWYMRPDWFRNGICGDKPDAANLSATHIHLRDIQAKPQSTMSDVYAYMQAENWSPNGEARSLIMSKGLQHTSMSVGDVVVVDGVAHVVARIGFDELGPVPQWSIIDMDTANRPGEKYTVLARLFTREAAEAWVAEREKIEPEKVHRGGFGIDGPEGAQ